MERGPAAGRRVSLGRLLLVLAAALGLCAEARAQAPAHSLAGVVVSGADSTPVAGAFVEIAGTTLHTTTDAGGQFAFRRTPPGILVLRAARIGFLPAAVRLRTDSAATPAVTVVLVPAPIEVSPVVVTASRETHLAEDAPTSVSVATSEDIEHRATLGVDEAIALVPGVQILDGQINIRGSSGYAEGLGSRVLLLIDGVPVNQGDRGGINWDLLPVTEVERVEVLKGTGSALYGSAALGGVVNVITREIADAPQFTARLFSGAYADPPPLWRWRSARALFAGADLGMSRRVGPLRLLVSGGALDNQGYRENNSDRRSHALAKLVFEPGPSLQAELYASAVHENVGNVVFWCEQGQCVDRGLAYQPFRVDSTTLRDRLLSDKYQVQATARRILGPVLALNARVSWFRTSFQDRFRADSNGSTADRFGAELGAEWHPSAGHVINAGIEDTYSTVTSDLFGDHSQTELAWFAETETQVADSVRVSLGGRLDAIAVDAVGWSAVGSPRLAVTWQLPAVRLRASVGRGFRAPSLAERFTNTAEQGIRVIPNPNLQDETSWAGEAGATTRLGERFELDAALFWNEYQNLIEPGLVSGGTQIQFANVTRARVRGLDLTARAAALADGHLSGELAYTFLDARDLTLDEPLAFRPQHLATLSADWVFGRKAGRGSTLAAGFDARLASSPQRVEIFESDRRVPAQTLDLRATWRRGGLEVIGKVENVFNYIYTLVPRTLEPPRTYSLSLATTW
ncbi:MAG: TonB-dependent receptor [Gemmatimonadales bacterium]|jgi:iron complex outermembrane receptor protein